MWSSMMKFHSVHGGNIVINESGCEAVRISSFCDSIAFSDKPLAINSFISLVLQANEEWNGALLLGLTNHDPMKFSGTTIPRYAYPDLVSKKEYWARPLPEEWAATGTKLTFYVNPTGSLHLFVNNDYKSAIICGLPTKDRLWIFLDLYGITISAKFVGNNEVVPVEVMARGPDAVAAYQNDIENGSISHPHTRIMLIGPPAGGKTALKKMLAKESTNKLERDCGIETSYTFQTSKCSSGSWILSEPGNNVTNLPHKELQKLQGPNVSFSARHSVADDCDANQYKRYEEEYFSTMAANIVHELQRQKKETKEDKPKLPITRSGLKMPSNIAKIAPCPKKKNNSTMNTDIPNDLPSRVVELVNIKRTESSNKRDSEKLHSGKKTISLPIMTFNIWDYSGNPKFFIFHQLFLSTQAIYLLVFDLTQELHAQVLTEEDKLFPEYAGVSSITTLMLIHMWLELIYVCVSYSASKKNQQRTTNNDPIALFPLVIIVGTKKDALRDETQIQQQFQDIKESLQDKVYFQHVLPTFFALNSGVIEHDNSIQDLCKKVEELACELLHIGVEIPLKWISFEKAIGRLLDRDVYFADINKLSEVARLENIESEEEFRAMVHFFHNRGKLWHLGSDVYESNGIVVLNPQWFIDCIYKLLTSTPHRKELNSVTIDDRDNCENVTNDTSDGIVTTEFFKTIWPNAFHHIGTFLTILDYADVIRKVPYPKDKMTDCNENNGCYFLPWLLRLMTPENRSSHDALIFILEFSTILPVSFYTRFLCRLYRWSKHPLSLKDRLRRKLDYGAILVDYNHYMIVSKISSKRIKMTLVQIKECNEVMFVPPSSHVCAKLRHLILKECDYLLDNTYKRVLFNLSIPCPCDKNCDIHSTPHCLDDKCLHLISLSKCLSKKVVECDYRLVKTDFIRKLFNTDVTDYAEYKKADRFSQVSSSPSILRSFWEDHETIVEEPSWLQDCAKMLSPPSAGRDWNSLAKRLGYVEKEMKKFRCDIYPSASLLCNWLESNGYTRYCIDLLLSCLEQMSRQDVISRIQADVGRDSSAAPVFISYQWDAQDVVLYLRHKLELAGFPCWMDVGHIGGGDNLYGRIYEGISQAKVVLCCLTPRYVQSPACSREISLADVLRKPIVPVMIEPTPWPLTSPMALVLSSLVYIDLCDVGAHGGCGRQSDLESRFQNIIQRISHYSSPIFSNDDLMVTPSNRMISLDAGYSPKSKDSATDGTRQCDSVESRNSADGADDVSIASSREHETSISPTWDQRRSNNTVLRCSICVIL